MSPISLGRSCVFGGVFLPCLLLVLLSSCVLKDLLRLGTVGSLRPSLSLRCLLGVSLCRLLLSFGPGIRVPRLPLRSLECLLGSSPLLVSVYGMGLVRSSSFLVSYGVSLIGSSPSSFLESRFLPLRILLASSVVFLG